MDLALNNLKELICHKTRTNKQTNKQKILKEANYFIVERKKKEEIYDHCPLP